MDVLYVLVPLSVVLVFVIVGVLAWSVWNGQFDGIEQEGERILEDDDSPGGSHPR
jgi:cbb3-type cytochrome oxidase maturation protein